jgi:hypothetical protein
MVKHLDFDRNRGKPQQPQPNQISQISRPNNNGGVFGESAFEKFL